MDGDTDTPPPAKKNLRAKAPRTPAQQEATRKALEALAQRRKELALVGDADSPAAKAEREAEKVRRQAAARAIIEGEHKTVAHEIAELKTLVAQSHLDMMEAAATATKAKAPAAKKKRVVVVSESEESDVEEVVVVKKRRAAPAPAPAVAAAPAPEPVIAAPAKPKRPQLDRNLFSR